MSPHPAEGPLEARTLQGWRQTARELAREAGGMITRALADRARQARSSAELIEKSPGDWSSELDAAVEDHLRSGLAQRYPDHGFFGEEGQGQQPGSSAASAHATGDSAADRAAGGFGRSAQVVWVVDPIDGSANFIRGYPQFSVSIAAVQGGEPVAGCVFDPVRQECFSAALGQGADCNGQPLSVSATTELIRALAGTVFPKPQAPFMESYLRELGAAMRACGGVRRSGSMALELAYLAAGRLDLFWERGMGAWDAAAGVLLIREAGGQVWALDGLAWWRSQALAASNPALRHAWADLLR